jgi:outer membrane lipoprotein-sorting protein
VLLAGIETQAGRRVYHLQVTDKSGQAQQIYLDAETGLETRIVTQGAGGTFEQDLSDYRDVSGIKVPFSIRMVANGVQQSAITVSKVEFNVPLDDRLFKMTGAASR